jgi:hypothetical protein
VQDRLIDDVVGAVPTTDGFEPVDPQVGEQVPVELLDLRRTVQGRPGRPTTSCSASGWKPATIATLAAGRAAPVEAVLQLVSEGGDGAAGAAAPTTKDVTMTAQLFRS